MKLGNEFVFVIGGGSRSALDLVWEIKQPTTQFWTSIYFENWKALCIIQSKIPGKKGQIPTFGSQVSSIFPPPFLREIQRTPYTLNYLRRRHVLILGRNSGVVCDNSRRKFQRGKNNPQSEKIRTLLFFKSKTRHLIPLKIPEKIGLVSILGTPVPFFFVFFFSFHEILLEKFRRNVARTPYPLNYPRGLLILGGNFLFIYLFLFLFLQAISCLLSGLWAWREIRYGGKSRRGGGRRRCRGDRRSRIRRRCASGGYGESLVG